MCIDLTQIITCQFEQKHLVQFIKLTQQYFRSQWLIVFAPSPSPSPWLQKLMEQ